MGDAELFNDDDVDDDDDADEGDVDCWKCGRKLNGEKRWE
jgi:hypothetical protein